MCIIAIIMIALCIPNQIQIANAAEGDNTTGEVIIKDEDGKEWTDSVNLDLFPENTGKAWNVMPGDKGDYTFYIENKVGYKVDCEIRLKAKVDKRKDLAQADETYKADTTYPIKFQLYKRENDNLTKLLGSTGMNPLDYPAQTITHTETLDNGETCEYVLSWLFEQVDGTFNGGNYDFTLKVNAKQVTETDDNPVTPPTPDNPDNPDNPDTPDNPSKPDDGNKDDDNKKDDNNNSNNNGNNGNNSNNNNSNNNGNNNGSNSNGSQNGNNNSSNNNKGNNTNNGSDDSKGNESSSNNQGNNQNNNQNNLNIDNTSNKGTGSTTNKKKVNTSDITTPVIYVALMILTFGLILLVKGRKENS